ncbi:MAG: DUF4783 domain-containing protein [Bacteroidales bacterium]
MKMIIIAPLLSLLMAMANPANVPEWKQIEQAFATGNATRLSAYFAPTVTLSVEGNKGNFSNRQARSIMQDFFSQHPPKSFAVKNTGTTGKSSPYYLCTYESSKGARYSAYILFVTGSGKSLISHITFEKN